MELLQVCPLTFAHYLYKMFKAAARLRFLPKEWDWSVLVPLFKGI